MVLEVEGWVGMRGWGYAEESWICGRFWDETKFSTSGCSDMIEDDVLRT